MKTFSDIFENILTVNDKKIENENMMMKWK